MVDWLGSFVSAFMQVMLDRMANPVVIAYLRRNHIDDALLNKLKVLLLLAAAVLSDAEEKQFVDPSLKEWLDKLQSAAFDADDLLDQIATKMKAHHDPEPVTYAERVRDYVSALNPLAQGLRSKLDSIVEMLEFILKHVDHHPGIKGVGVAKLSLSSASATTSLVGEHVYGRDGDSNKILDFLLSDKEGLTVVAMVGMGGLGKTTLAQVLYNNERVRHHFHSRSWVSVSEISDVCEITKRVFESFTLWSCYSNTSDLNVLQIKLQDRLARKRFLLVLDDCLNENCLDWDILRRPFLSGGKGSKIIITTRSQSVAMAVPADFIHSLSCLSDEDTWHLFSYHAFKSGAHESPAFGQKVMLEIGQKIAKRCDGLPLAAKVLGSLLRSKQNAEEWENISRSRIWELPSVKSGILPALILSYKHLPSTLKRCFAYCSIFPKGHEIKKQDLIYLWMAEGILSQRETDKRMEDVGNECFQELLCRSFFHQTTIGESHFRMHDLINDLAQFVAGDFCYNMVDNPRRIQSSARYLSYSQDKFESFIECQQLRTFLPFKSSRQRSKPAFSSMITDVLKKQNRLRALSLSNYQITNFPDSVGNFLHLRYLNLAHTAIEYLPDYVCNWYNLETLILSSCAKLKKLPEDMYKLVSLRHLDVSQSGVIEMPAKLGRLKSLQVLTNFIVASNDNGSTIMELGELSELHGTLSIGNLQNIARAEDATAADLKSKKYLAELEFTWKETRNAARETEVLNMLMPHQNVKRLKIKNFGGNKLPNWLGISAFSRMVFLQLVDCKSCLSLPSLGQLPSLEELYIAKMRRLRKVDLDFYGHATVPFKSLKILKFEDMPIWEEWSTSQHEQRARFPLLKELHINRCPKLTQRLPDQLPALEKLVITSCEALMGSSISSRMMFLKLVDCKSFLPLSSLGVGHLGSLEELYISKMGELQSLGPEFYGNDYQLGPFTSLKILKFEDMSLWEEWSNSNLDEQGETLFPSLKELHINRCPKLTGRLPDMLPSLEKLVITGCQLLTGPIPKSPKFRELELTECGALELRFESVTEGNHCSSLTLTPIFRDGLSRTPNLMQDYYYSLKQLYLESSCNSLKHLPLSLFANLEELHVEDCMMLERISYAPNSTLPLPYLRKLTLKGCSKLVFPEGGLSAPKLESLSISNCVGLSTQATWGLQAMTSLTSLHISEFPSLTSLDHTGIQHLISLKILEIEGCHQLASLPLIRLVHSLSSLTIRGCPSLKYRCMRGEYRHLVSFVPSASRIIEDWILIVVCVLCSGLFCPFQNKKKIIVEN